jgi:chemosensory pili system protein ChpA (sensor histidine kinase/response regulator)
MASLTKKILVVDDSESINKSISDTLTLEGYEVYMAYDGLQAVDFLTVRKIDLMITDLSMPKMDGYELIRFVRTESMTPEMPIIVITADISKSAELIAFKEGANQFLLKPFNDDNLIDTIERLLVNKYHE